MWVVFTDKNRIKRAVLTTFGFYGLYLLFIYKKNLMLKAIGILVVLRCVGMYVLSCCKGFINIKRHL